MSPTPQNGSQSQTPISTSTGKPRKDVLKRVSMSIPFSMKSQVLLTLTEETFYRNKKNDQEDKDNDRFRFACAPHCWIEYWTTFQCEVEVWIITSSNARMYGRWGQDRLSRWT